MTFSNQTIIGAVAVTLMIAGFLLLKKEPQPQGMEQAAATSIDAAMQNYIEQHPEVIIKSLEEYQERKAGEMMAQLSANIKAKKADLEQKAGDPKVGPDAANVKVIEFFDYGCVFCRKMQPIMAKAMQSNPDIQVVFKEMPMFGEASTSAAKTALAIYKIDPSKYYQFHTNLMKSQNSNVSAAAIEVATGLGINADRLKQAMQDPELDKLLADNRKLATEIGVRGAPALIVNGELFIGLMEQEVLQAKIDAAKGVKPEAGGSEMKVVPAPANDNNGTPALNAEAKKEQAPTNTAEEKKSVEGDVTAVTSDKPAAAAN
ncbi:MAG: DsbA family protein [Proteobacteria bacterium]|nr:DsbA family protein [Pseudomonadota bacterium]